MMLAADSFGVPLRDEAIHTGIDVISLAPGSNGQTVKPLQMSTSDCSAASRLACALSKMPLTGACCSMCSASSEIEPKS